jgi:hypothetical protein
MLKIIAINNRNQPRAWSSNANTGAKKGLFSVRGWASGVGGKSFLLEKKVERPAQNCGVDARSFLGIERDFNVNTRNFSPAPHLIA